MPVRCTWPDGATAAAAVIEAAGGEVAADWESYKPITHEAVVALDPDLVLLTNRGLESLGGVEALLAMPGLAGTRVAKAGAVVSLDDVKLLTLGPRAGEAVVALNAELVERFGGAEK